MTMHGVFHPKSSTARLYTSRKEGGKGLHNIENFVCQEEQSLKSCVSRKADSDPLMAECKRLSPPGRSQMKRQPPPGIEVCQKLKT